MSYKNTGGWEAAKIVPLSGNVLDLAFVDIPKVGHVAVVSVDHVHEPGSTSVVRSEPVSQDDPTV